MSGISGAFDVGSPRYSAVAASANGGTTIVTNGGAQKIRVMAANMIASAAVNVKWQTSSGADLTGFAYLTSNGGYILPYNQLGWFETVATDDLVVFLSGGIPVGGHLTYILA